MEYRDLVKDFATRTQHNLRIITDCQRSGNEAYEVTQLINSMLGLLVFPQQRYYERLPSLTMSRLRELGWPEPILKGDIGELEDLRELFRYLRNGIAHFNLDFTATDGVLDGVVIWNHPGGNPRKPRDWQVTLRLQELAEITDRFIDLILETEES